MKLFFWKNNFVIDSFAKKLADDFFSSAQADIVNAYFSEAEQAGAGTLATASGSKKTQKPPSRQQQHTKQQQQIERGVHDTALKLAQFKAQEKLGVYGKARLHMSFAERLAELGYSKETVQQLNRMLLLKSP